MLSYRSGSPSKLTGVIAPSSLSDLMALYTVARLNDGCLLRTNSKISFGLSGRPEVSTVDRISSRGFVLRVAIFINIISINLAQLLPQS